MTELGLARVIAKQPDWVRVCARLAFRRRKELKYKKTHQNLETRHLGSSRVGSIAMKISYSIPDVGMMLLLLYMAFPSGAACTTVSTYTYRQSG